MTRLLTFLISLLLPLSAFAQSGLLAAQAPIGQIVDPGNALTLNFDPANISGGAPPGWGTSCVHVNVGATNGGAFWYQTIAPNTKGFTMSLEFILASTTMVDGTAITLAISKAEGSIYTAQRNWRLYLRRMGANYRFLLVVDEDAEEVAYEYPTSGSIAGNTLYPITVTYDIVHQQIAWTVSGVTANTIKMIPGNPQNVATRFIGSSQSSDARNTIYLLDKVIWTEIGTSAGTEVPVAVTTANPVSLKVPAVSWSMYPNPAADPAITTAAAYLANASGEATAMAKMMAAGADHAPRYLKWRDVEANLGVYDWTKIDALVATSGELPLVLNLAPIWDDGNTSLPTGITFTDFSASNVITAYQNMLTALQSHVRGRLYVLIVGNEVDTYLTTSSRRAQYATFLAAVRTTARSLFGPNPFKLTTSLRSTTSANWSDWTGIAAAIDLTAFTYYPPSAPDTFGATIASDLTTLISLGPFMFQELGVSSTATNEAVQSAEAQALAGVIGSLVQEHRIPVVTFASLSELSPAVIADFGYSSGQFSSGIGLRSTANLGTTAYVTLCGVFGGTGCNDPPPPPPPTCTFTLAASSDTFSVSSGSDTVALTASDAGCAWTRQILDGAPSWLTVTPASGTGSATITYSVTANTDTASRSARFTIGDGDIFAITQDGATPPPPPPPPPAINCNSTTASPTGRTPVMRWTPCRQDKLNRMYADYLANPTNPATLGGKWMKLLIDRANAPASACAPVAVSPCAYADMGQYDTMVYQVTGDLTYAARAYAKLTTAEYSSLRFTQQRDANQTRYEGAQWVWMFDWLYNTLTPDQKTFLTTRITDHLEVEVINEHARGGEDSDQVVAIYFAMAELHLLLPNDARITAIWNGPAIGGWTPIASADSFFPSDAGATSTFRDALRYYVEKRAEGGEWFESAMYNIATPLFIIEGADAIRTATGIDYFPEITAWTPKYAERLLHTMTPDLKEPFQWRDEQNPHRLRGFDMTHAIGITAGVLTGTAAARRLQGLLLDMVAKYGATGSGSMTPAAQIDAAAMFIYYDPYEVAENWKVDQAFVSKGIGLLSYQTGWAATDSRFFAHFGRIAAITRGAKAGISPPIDHDSWYHGDFLLYRNGETVIDHPFGYGGPDVSYGEGSNNTLIHGMGSMVGYRDNNFASSTDSNHAYAVGTTGGSAFTYGTYLNPRIFAHESTRELLYVPGTTDTIITYDRMNVTDLLDLSWYQTYAPSNAIGSPLLFNLPLKNSAPASKIYILHTPVSPTIVGNEISWLTPVKSTPMTWTALLPATKTTSIINEATRTTGCVAQWGCWPWTNATDPQWLKFHVKLWQTTETQFETFLNVIQAGTKGVVTLKQANGAEGAHVTRPGLSDVLAVFNGTQGASLPLQPYDPATLAALDVVRFRGVGYGPIAWTAVGSSTLVYLYDLNPQVTWTLNIDGAGANAIVPAASGEYTFSVSGAGAHSITIVGTGTAPPPDPVGCPTIIVAPSTLPSGTTGAAYSQTISASGGAGPYTFTVVPGGTLPTGLTLSSAGLLSGTPTVAADYTFTVQGSQADGCLDTQSYTVTIAAAGISGVIQRAGTAQPFADYSGSVSTLTGQVTVPAGSNRLAIVNVVGGAGVSDTLTSCTIGGSAVTLINKVRTPNDLWTGSYRLVAPSTGVQTFTCTWSGIPGTSLAAVVHFYVGVDPASPINVSDVFTSSSSATIHATLTTTKTDTWTVLFTRSWGAASAGVGSNALGTNLATFDFGPHTTTGLKTMEATYPSATIFGAVMFAINPAP